jgi:hypothetical protein
MPTICVFFGIVIRMYYDEHMPPHFHAYYGENSAIIEIETLRVRDGYIPKRAFALVLEWSQEHRSELMSNWQLAEKHQPLNNIAPLE